MPKLLDAVKKAVTKRAPRTVAPKDNKQVTPAPAAAPKKSTCSNCDDSGMTCSVCRTGYDV